MKKRIISLCLIVCLLLTVLPVTAFAAEETVSVLVAGYEEYAMAGQVAELVNQERADNGRQALTWNEELTELAMLRAAELALFYGSGHERPNGTICFTVLEGTEFEMGWAGENIAAGQSSARQVVTDWMNSQGHRENILDENYTQIGIGSFTSGGLTTWVQIFSSVEYGGAVTRIPERAQGLVEVETLVSYLDTPKGVKKAHTMEPGETLEYSFTNTNQGYPYMKTSVVPLLGEITDETGKVVARTHEQDNGAGGMAVVLTAVNPGSGVWEVRLYEGQEPMELHTIEVSGPEIFHITVDPSENGHVSVEAAQAEPGDQVDVTVRPDEGFVLSAISCTGSQGKVSLSRIDDTTYRFTMPRSDVRIHAEFDVVHTHRYGSEYVRDEQGNIFAVCLDCGGKQAIDFPFQDIEPKAYYFKGVLWAVEEGVTSGMSENRFAPDEECTRAQVVTFLWRAAGCPEPAVTDHPFTDVKRGAFYYKAMLWAVEQGITKGLTETTFGPGQSCTRAQVVTFLHRALGAQEPTSMEHPFLDVKESAFYYRAMLWAVEEKITSGMSKTTFAPDTTCTRGQIVTFLYRAFAQ